jgi:hypothetical protein
MVLLLGTPACIAVSGKAKKPGAEGAVAPGLIRCAEGGGSFRTQW